jgi:glycosyltransferase involved in cell wall biosynthesis
LSWYYSQGSVFVLPSIEEGLALVLSQAMACGLPIIATPNTGAEELITDGREGFIIEARSPQAIQEKIIFLYERPDIRDEMARAALARSNHLGGWESYGKKMMDVYSIALSNRM